MKTLVCIGFAEAMAAVEGAWSLADVGLDVVAFGRRGRRSALRHSRHVSTVEITPPESDWNATVAELAEFLVSRERSPEEPAVLLPLDDAAVWLCDQAITQPGWLLAGPRAANARLALDKLLQNDVARAAGLPVPETTYAAASKDVFLRANHLPLVLKPAKAAFVCGARLRKGRNWICGNHEELQRAVAEWGEQWPVLFQPFFQSTADTV